MNDWTIPDSFPDLSSAKTISLDVETRDDDLKTKGPGVRRDAYLIGVAIGTDDGFRGYYPIAHDEGPNLNKRNVLRWLKRELGRYDQIKLGTNLLYDTDFLAEAGVDVAGPWYDVQVAEPLIDENKQGRYNLDDLASHYLGREKKTTALEIECERRKYKGAVQKHLWRLPADLVGPYAIEDVDLPLAIFPKQRNILENEDLWDLFLLETRLTPLLLDMRRIGVRLDSNRLEKTIGAFDKKLKSAKRRLKKMTGFDVEYWAADSIARAFDSEGLDYPRTPKTKKPSFTKPWLRSHPHPMTDLIVECRQIDKFIGTFLRGQMMDQMIGDRLHCLFNQLKSDEYGTVTGRFSSSHPNLQFIPIRDEEMGPLCRSMFVPEEEHDWGKADYSQIEFRIFAHYALGRGSRKFQDEYRRNPNVDFHAWCAEMAGIGRRPAKTINFGLIYGMGIKKLARSLDISEDEARTFLAEYNGRLPFIKQTLRKVSQRADERGYVFTILKRRRRFDRWEPADWDLAQSVSAVTDRDAMIKTVNHLIGVARERDADVIPRKGVRRAGTYKALNALVQGSAADVMKKAMVDCYESGVFDVLVPHLTVHDEMDVSIPRTSIGREAFIEMKRTMENTIEFRVPIVVDVESGPNWARVKEVV